MVYTKKGQRLSEARVVHTKDGVSLFFDNYKLHDARVKSRVDFFDEQLGLVVAVCETVIFRNPSYPTVAEPWMGDCKILEIIEIVQRQRDVRTRTNLEVSFKSDQQVEFYGTIENLSAGGLYFTTRQPLNKDQLLSFKYTFRNMDREFKTKTLWVKHVPGGAYGYGCRFVDLSAGAEAAIRSYVYKILLERQKKST